MLCLLENGNYNRGPILSWGQAARQAGAVASLDNRLLKRVKPEVGTGAVGVVGSSPQQGKAEILKAES
jgi:hypothetical protein